MQKSPATPIIRPESPRNRFKHGAYDSEQERAPSPILTPPCSPLQECQRIRSGGLRGDLPDLPKRSKPGTATVQKDIAPELSSPINIPMSKAKNDLTPGLAATSLNSLNNIPESQYLVGRSRYTNQPITIEYFVTERFSSSETTKDGQPLKKQATTIRSVGDYQVIRTVGSGSTGKVKMAVNIRSEQKVAIKIITKKYISDPGKNSKETAASRERRILREAAILNLADHPNIVKLHDLYVTSEYYCMVFEYVDGGQMLDYIISHGKVKENVARRFFRQLLSAVAYCHQNGIVHRDLKIENVLVDTKGDVKLVDFGLSNFYDPEQKLRTFCGSLYFAAPELLRGIVYTGPEIDVWSLGIILYVLVCGKVPFDDKSLSALHEKIKSGKFVLPSHLSPECRSLLQLMIEVDPIRRAQLHEVMNHPWTCAGAEGSPLPSIDDHVLVRARLTDIDSTIESFIVKEFPYQFDRDMIHRTLRDALADWSRYSRHPIVTLYMLASMKHQTQLTSPFQTSTATPTASILVPRAKGIELAPSPSASMPMMAFSEGMMPATMLHPTSQLSRKRSDSMPAADKSSGVKKLTVPPKSKRSSSLQSTPKELEAILEEQKQNQQRQRLGMETLHEEPYKSPVLSIESAGTEISVRNVYLRGIFSVNTTSTKTPRQIRARIMATLTGHHPSIIVLDRESYFICEYQASASRSSLMDDDDDTGEILANDDLDISRVDLHEEDDMVERNKDLSMDDLKMHAEDDLPTTALTLGAEPLRSIRFEIHIVRVALLGLHGVQFKRISGDFSVYKNLCTQLLEEFNL